MYTHWRPIQPDAVRVPQYPWDELRAEMPRSTVAERAMCCLYTHGPMSPSSLAALMGSDVARTLQDLVQQGKIAARTVVVSGQAVELIYLRGNAP